MRDDVPRDPRRLTVRGDGVDLAVVLETVSPGSPAHLVGHDWGSIQGWEAVTSGSLDESIASFTSMSGPGLDHAAAWMRARLSLDWSRLRPLFRQSVRSWYTAFFQIPRVAELGWRTVVPLAEPGRVAGMIRDHVEAVVTRSSSDERLGETRSGE